MVRIVFMKWSLPKTAKCLSEEEVQFSDENSDESQLSLSPECEIGHESHGAFASPSVSEDEDVSGCYNQQQRKSSAFSSPTIDKQ